MTTTNDSTEESKKTEKSGFIEPIIRSYQNLWRSIIFFSFISLAIAVLTKIISSSILTTGNVSVEMNTQGRIIYKYSGLTKGSDQTYSSFLLPSNELWYDTGIDLEANQKIKISISGRAHLAIHKLVEAAQKDEKSVVDWTKPEGTEKWGNLKESKEQLNAKKELLVKPGNAIGNVVLYMCPTNNLNDFRTDFIQNRAKYNNNTYSVKKDQEYSNDSKETVRLFLSINDILLDFSNAQRTDLSRIAYNRLGRPQNFDVVMAGKFNEVWFADNIGSFLVNVQISSK